MAFNPANVQDICTGVVTVPPDPPMVGGEVTVRTVTGNVWPDVPFAATIYPETEHPDRGNNEIVAVTAVTVNGTESVLQIARARSGTLVRNVRAGDRVSHTITAETLRDIAQGPETDMLATYLAAKQ